MSDSKVLMTRKRMFPNSNFLKGECVIGKTRNSKFKMSWILVEEINKIIDMGIALGFDYKDKEVGMVDVFAKAISKLKGVRQKMVKNQWPIFVLLISSSSMRQSFKASK
ncbi:hypothetical protein LWI29_001713 [Acer saccharum]|uniref:Uncharacterized protein n=1 Tax=Acer saccharum TaxID=4024 RepID=A0AA39SQT0_ACESA|nr:hypothetical protein LWI29_001713 [Acer saccharum]